MMADAPARDRTRRQVGIKLLILAALALVLGIVFRRGWLLGAHPGWQHGIALTCLYGFVAALWGGLWLVGKRNLAGPFLGLLVVYVLFMSIAPPSFTTLGTTRMILTHAVIVGVAALGMTMIIVSGGIDLSVGSVVALSSVVAAWMLQWRGHDAVFLAVLAAVAAGAAIGGVNGTLSSGLRIVPFIVTLGTMQIARGLAKWLANSQMIFIGDTWLTPLMEIKPKVGWLQVGPGVILLLALTVVVALVLRRTVFGRYVYALGSNEDAARLCGIRVVPMRILIYTLGGAFAGLAGVLQFAQLSSGDPTAGIGMELDVIAAVVIGGGSLSGGEGGAVGALIGALMIAVLRDGCTQVGIGSHVQDIVIGSVIIGAAAVDRLKHRRGT